LSKLAHCLIPVTVAALLLPITGVTIPTAIAQNARPPVVPLDPLRNTVPAVEDDWLMFNHDQQRTGWNNG
jgi:hypothetical protein